MHDGYDHHHHDHDHAPAETAAEMTAVLTYMLQHNIHHGEELKKLSETLAEKGMAAASEEILEGVRFFEQGNQKLAAALELVKKEG